MGKVSAMTSATTTSGADYFPIVQSGSNKRLTVAELNEYLDGAPALSAKDMDGFAIFGHAISINAQTGTTYTVLASDAGKLITMANAAANTITLPAAATSDAGMMVAIVQKGAGTTTVAVTGGDSLRSKGGLVDLNGQYAGASATRISSSEWLLVGDLA